MHGSFCDQPWRGNDPGDGLGISCTESRVTIRRTRLTPCACPMFCGDATFFCDLGKLILGILPRLKKYRITRKKILRSVIFSRNEKKRLIPTLMETIVIAGQLFRDLATSPILVFPGWNTIANDFRPLRVTNQRQPQHIWCHPRARSDVQLCSPQSLHPPAMPRTPNTTPAFNAGRNTFSSKNARSKNIRRRQL